jgi:hypothetical protein
MRPDAIICRHQTFELFALENYKLVVVFVGNMQIDNISNLHYSIKVNVLLPLPQRGVAPAGIFQ